MIRAHASVCTRARAQASTATHASEPKHKKGTKMQATNFTEETLSGQNEEFQETVNALHEKFEFDFTSIGITTHVGAPLKWVYSAGETSERHRRIALSPGHGIGGIVLKAGKPMLFTNIDAEIDPREYSSYPIVFAEDLHSFCALPLKRNNNVVAVLLCAHRSVSPANVASYNQLIDYLHGRVCDLDVVSTGFMNLDEIINETQDSQDKQGAQTQNNISRIINAQESERHRISRELHDGVSQELLTVTFLLNRLQDLVEGDAKKLAKDANQNIKSVMDELHNISVLLRPSALDHMGFVPALRSQALVLEKTYGTRSIFEGDLHVERFDKALETQAYRICQEAMTNACKYANVETIKVLVERAEEGKLRISVIDAGCGFDINAPKIKGSGCGLLGMQERAEIVGAQLDIQSGAGGTRIVLTTPMSLTSEDAEASAGASVSAQAAGAGAGTISANSPAGANEIAAHQTTN